MTCLTDSRRYRRMSFHTQITNLQWRLTVDVPLHRDINNLIMDYLISEGYPSAAKKFAHEANIQPRVDSESINERVDIRNAIYAGDIQLAIEKINDLNPQVCSVQSSRTMLKSPLFNILHSTSFLL